MADRTRGLLILFEGVDRSGKTTQSEMLKDRLGEGVKLIHFPDRSTCTGKIINEYLSSKKNNKEELDDRTIHLLFSANRWEAVQKIRDTLEEGIHVILDRYAHSGAAYTLAKGDIPAEWCFVCDKGLPEPDLIFYLDVPVDVTETRGGFGQERYEEVAFQRRVYRAYQDVLSVSKNVFVVDGTIGVEEVHQLVYDHFCQTQTSHRDWTTGKLWEKQ